MHLVSKPEMSRQVGPRLPVNADHLHTPFCQVPLHDAYPCTGIDHSQAFAELHLAENPGQVQKVMPTKFQVQAVRQALQFVDTLLFLA